MARSMRRWGKTEALDMISGFSNPTNLIAQNGKRPRLENSPEYLSLAQALKTAGYISSYSLTKHQIQINTFKSLPSSKGKGQA